MAKMSLTNVRGYFRTHFKTQSFKEWKDGFNRDDIPHTAINKSFHILSPTIVQTNHNQIHLELVETVECQFILKGFRYPADAIDDAHSEIEGLLKLILGHENRTKSVSGIKNVVLENIDIEAYNEDNDNMVRATMRFSVLVIIDVLK